MSYASVAGGPAAQVVAALHTCIHHACQSLAFLPRGSRADTQVFVVNADRFCVADRLCFAAVGLCVGLLLVLMADSALELKLKTKILSTHPWMRAPPHLPGPKA